MSGIASDKQINDVRLLLSSEEDVRVTDQLASQYLRATAGNVAQAASRLKHTLAWRLAERPETLRCRACVRDPRSHYMHVVGHDVEHIQSSCLAQFVHLLCPEDLGRPVIYSCLALASNRNSEDNRIHMLQTFETAIKLMEANIERWVWVSDFRGFSSRDCDPAIARIFLQLASQHYPERLAHFVTLDAPHLFSLLWNMIRPMVDPVTKQKVIMCKFNEMDKVFASLNFGPELRDWLTAEAKENRDKQLCKDKAYKLEDVLAEASKAADGTTAHNLYGTAALLAKIHSNPAVIKQC